MKDMKFDATTFEALQRLIYPLVEIILGFKVDQYVGEKSELFSTIGDGFSELSELFHIAAAALEDGILTSSEIEEIISKAVSVSEAISVIGNKFSEHFGSDEE